MLKRKYVEDKNWIAEKIEHNFVIILSRSGGLILMQTILAINIID